MHIEEDIFYFTLEVDLCKEKFWKRNDNKGKWSYQNKNIISIEHKR